MRPKSLILLVLALGCGLIASVGINQVMANRRNGNTNQPTETVPILVALGEISGGDPLKPEMLSLEQWPKNNVPTGAIGQLAEIEGRVTRVRFYPGEPILEAKLLGKGEKSAAASAHIPAGYRVVSVRVDAVSSSSGLILPNDRVDVLVHVMQNQSKGIPETSTTTFLQNVKVFAVDDLFDRKDEGSVAAKTISLLVTPKQAELVILATQLGTIQLVMRSSTDEGNSSASGSSVGELLNNNDQLASRPTPVVGPPGKNSLINLLNQPIKPDPQAKPKTGAWVMEVIEGGTVREVEFDNDERAGKTVPGSTKKLDPTAGTKKLQADEEEPAAAGDGPLVTPVDPE